MNKTTIQSNLDKLKEVLAKSSFIFEEEEYKKLKNLLVQKEFHKARKFLDRKIENCENDSDLLVLKEIEDIIFDFMTNN